MGSLWTSYSMDFALLFENLINFFMKYFFDEHAWSWASQFWRPCYFLQILRRHLLSNRVKNVLKLFLLRIKHSTRHYSQNVKRLSLKSHVLPSEPVESDCILQRKIIGWLNQKSTLICIFNHNWLHIVEQKKVVINKRQKSSILAIATTSLKTISLIECM